MKNLLSLLLLLQISQYINAQNQAIGQWREHLPYNRGLQVADAGDKVYCSTADALFAYVREDGNLERFTKLNGLNDFGISTTAYSTDFQVLIIAYYNGNIDLLYDNNVVYNLPFIKEKNITGNKSINSIYIKGKLAYLACGFGIVVLDIERQEVKDTYIIGDNGSNMNVLDITDDNIYIYAATDSGVFNAPVSGVDLADFNNWNVSLIDTGNAGDFNLIQSFGGKTYVNYARPDAFNTGSDELWVLENGLWSQVNHPDLPQWPKRYSMKVMNNELIIVNDYSVSLFDTQLQRTHYFDNSYYPDVLMRDASMESNGTLWVADFGKGLVKLETNHTTSVITPKGPYSSYTAEIAIDEGRLWVAHGPRSSSWNPQEYPIDGFSLFKDGDWQSWNRTNSPSMSANKFFSNMNIAIVPGQPDHIRVASVTSGMLDFNNNTFTYYNKSNSTLIPAHGNEGETIIHGMAHDENGNLWVVNSGVDSLIHVLKNDNTWRRFRVNGTGSPFAGYILIDESNFKWVNLFGGGGVNKIGLAVYDDANTIDNPGDDRQKFIPMLAAIPRCMALDHDGQIWVGTDNGPHIIYSPAAAFDGDVTPQQILIKQDNTYQYLLEGESISAIAVDGANRKWLGTLSSGVYLLSSDGQEEIHHFTAENSPLFSNNISCITIDPETGEVFFGTDEGMISYQSDAVEGSDICESVMVYPNPVRPGYIGPIAIKGVMNNAKVKITDISGSLVFEGNALGGQAIWNGQNLKGEKAHTGVYLVFASDDTGENACVTKLLFVK